MSLDRLPPIGGGGPDDVAEPVPVPAPSPAAPAVAAAAAVPAPAQPVATAATPAPVVQAAPVVTNTEAITITQAERERIEAERRELTSLREAEAQRREAERRAEEQRQLEAGNFQALIASRDQELATERTRGQATEARFRNTLRDAELSHELGRHTLADSESAAQLAALWSNQLTTVPEGEKYHVRSLDGKSVKDFVAAKLASPEYEKFLPPKGRGGAPTVQASGSEIARPQRPNTFKAQDESLAAAIQAQSGNRLSGLAGMPSKN